MTAAEAAAISGARPWTRVLGARHVASSTAWLGAYGLALAGAQLVGLAAGGVATALIDGGLVAVLLVHHRIRPRDWNLEILPVLALVALIPVVGIAAAVPWAPRFSWYLSTGAPLLVGACLAVRLIDRPVRRLHLRVRWPVLDIFVVDAGLPLGVLGYVLLGSQPLTANPGGPEIAATLLVLAVFGGLVEELIFRGLLLAAAQKLLKRREAAIVYVATLNAVLYVGSGSMAYAFLIAVAGIAWGAALARGASLWSVALSHAVMLMTVASLGWGMLR
jgi:membrane protease YdiL (CAAX protease family)